MEDARSFPRRLDRLEINSIAQNIALLQLELEQFHQLHQLSSVHKASNGQCNDSFGQVWSVTFPNPKMEFFEDGSEIRKWNEISAPILKPEVLRILPGRESLAADGPARETHVRPEEKGSC